MLVVSLRRSSVREPQPLELDGGVWPRHGRVGAERPGFCGAKDRALAGPGTPVAKEWPGMGKKRKVFL